MIQMNIGGTYENILTDTDFYMKLDLNFQQAFSNYLERNYGISEEQFRNILKTLAPEEFI